MNNSLALIDQHLELVRVHYDKAPKTLNWLQRSYTRLLGHYYRQIIPAEASILEIGSGTGELLSLLPNKDITGVDLSAEQIKCAKQKLPHGVFYQQAGERLEIDRTFDYIIISDTLNLSGDVQEIFKRLHKVSHERTRLVINIYSSLWRPLFSFSALLGLRKKGPQLNWLAPGDVHNLLELTNWQLIKEQARVLCPVPLLGFDRLINRWLAPLLPWFCLTLIHIARPCHLSPRQEKSVSIIIPARNEAGNIEAAVKRCPQLGSQTEIIFVEGGSQDGTWEEIQRVIQKYPDRKISALKQSGKGKGNAVREGFSAAAGDVLLILDADLTMPPEELPKYYDAIVDGKAEFVNGVRLVYPMEKEAMRFVNMCGNKFFSMAFSWLLGQPIKDTLCGTKVMLKSDYEKIAENRSYFGDFDPFGDFDLLFGADKLNLKIADVPIRYKERSYGETQIQRWKHGWLLMRMTFFAARKLRFI